jgi:hypothetical protein
VFASLEGWLAYATGVGGKSHFGSYFPYKDQKHGWQPLEEEGIAGPRFFLRWEKIMEPPEGFVFRLRVPGGWFVFIDFDEEGSSSLLVFCLDKDHEWTD